jgi:DNA invertase Pin-like site-specific DNA recombinase
MFGVVVVWRFDRFARNVKQLVMALEEFRALIIAARAELERSVIRERVVEGLEYGREHGTQSGQPIGRPKKVFSRDEAIKLRQRGMNVRAIAQQLDIGSGTVVRASKNFARETEPIPPQLVRGLTIGIPGACRKAFSGASVTPPSTAFARRQTQE